ncbi:formate dehydrogenase accessory protein FdhE [Afipia felis]|uniref:Protein FdhE homolog n=2 Tax=Afipia felis TaxID=1035 RepID=A0A380W613_AFIFE|nr:formate dehydrogenase accessory protein FdhE [Afipia felis]EKS31210.1 formate dehydrogenase accessory protein FdhE [Afipia felis ATCC 53690]SUU75952.1 formate dehydrogenase accessory protein FdhE [Afipia felis]SUU84019.1 formate dehydrogenase accessory protein FdhE [Afipia felis]
MSSVDPTAPDPSVISNIPTPQFARLPDPSQLFSVREARFAALAEGHDLAPYLKFLSGLCGVQAAIQDGLPEPDAIASEALERARQHGMPPLDRGHFIADAAFVATLDRLLAAAADIDMPTQARAALEKVTKADADGRARMVENVLAEAIPVEALAEHIFAAAALQVHFARLAARLDAKSLQPVGDGVCPSCGGAPTATVLVNWPRTPGARYCSCSLCGTLWNYVRSKCTLCGSTRKILFQEIEGAGNIKAETCDDCHGYMKVLNHQKDDRLDPVADDVATLGLDLLVRELGFRRGGVNPFLIGY